MTPLDVVFRAAGRVRRAPAILVGIWVATLASALPMMFVVRAAIVQHLGDSLEAETVASGANTDWILDFGDRATGVSATFGPSVIGIAAPLDNLNTLVEGTRRPLPLVAVAVGGLLLWTFLSGGAIDRYARDRPTGAHGFFQACGGFFAPLLRLAVVSAAVYAVLMLSWRPWLLDVVYERMTRNVDVERTAFAIRATLYAAFLLPLAACQLVFDYAKVRIVVEDRLSALGAIRAAVAFIRRRPLGTVMVYAGNVLILAAVYVGYAVVAPSEGTTGLSVWVGLAVGQGYLVARVASKLLWWASAVEWFFSQLAHVRYVERPQSVWPEPAVVEHAVRPSSLEPGESNSR